MTYQCRVIWVKLNVIMTIRDYYNVFTLFACFHKPPVADYNLKPVAEETMNIAHPTATLLD